MVVHMSAFLWDDPDQNQWSEITQIMVDQMNRWILVQNGFIGSFDLPWFEWSRLGSLILIGIISKEGTLSLDFSHLKHSKSCFRWRYLRAANPGYFIKSCKFWLVACKPHLQFYFSLSAYWFQQTKTQHIQCKKKTKSGRPLKSKLSTKYRPTPPPVLSLRGLCTKL